MPKSYVYILTDDYRNLMIKSGASPLSLTDKRLVYYEIYDDGNEAEFRKKTIESWPERKIEFLIDLVNPSWNDWKNEISPHLNPLPKGEEKTIPSTVGEG